MLFTSFVLVRERIREAAQLQIYRIVYIEGDGYRQVHLSLLVIYSSRYNIKYKKREYNLKTKT
jgi:hypothetical protein